IALSKISLAMTTRPGCATQVPSWPSPASRCLSARTFSIAASFAAASLRIGICAAIRHHRFRVFGEFLDRAVDVIPAAAIEAGGMVFQRVQNLVHLESGKDGLDQHGRFDRSGVQPELTLGL